MAPKVLIIDDAPAIHQLVRARLNGELIEITSAYDGINGLRIASELQPDLVLLDVEMPDPNGFEVCRRLKASAETVAIPIVFLTGASSSTEKIRGLELGAIDYVTKPFDPAELRARVRASLRTKYLMDLLAKRAQIDGLTGMWNRAYFQQRLTQELSLAQRHQVPLSCIMADIDHFKSINDRFGHPCGDDVLRTVGALIMSVCRKEDVVCRYGGEEFAVIAPKTASDGAATIAERIRDALAATPMHVYGTTVPLTMSLGIGSAVPTDNEQSLVDAADRALYEAKHAGRNRVVIAPEQRTAA